MKVVTAGKLFFFTFSMINWSAEICDTVFLFSLNPHCLYLICWLVAFMIRFRLTQLKSLMVIQMKLISQKLSDLVIVPDFGTSVMVEADHCDGILPIVIVLLQIMSRRSSRSQFIKTSGGIPTKIAPAAHWWAARG